jgi:hypothetical protein
MGGVITVMLLPYLYLCGGCWGGGVLGCLKVTDLHSDCPTFLIEPTYHPYISHHIQKPNIPSIILSMHFGLIINNVCKGILNLECLFVHSHYKKLKPTHMYTLDCSYYTKSFDSIDELINDVITSGMDPNYEIVYDGEPTGEWLIDLVSF